MKNLFRGHIYQLRRDYFFYGCLAVSIVYLFMSIRLTLSLASALSPLMGVDGLLDTFLGGDTILYAFMLLTANMVAETYRTGVMKNIIGRGIAKKQYYLSIVLTISGHADRRHHYGSSCRQQIWNGNHFLSRLLRSFRNRTHSFCGGAHQLCRYHDGPDQECHYRSRFWPCNSEHSSNSGNGFGIL